MACHQQQILSEVFPRCPHSVYLATEKEVETGRAHNCGLCRALFCGKETRKFEMPRAEDFHPGKLQANAVDPDACPTCQGTFFYSESTSRTCADCGATSKALCANGSR